MSEYYVTDKGVRNCYLMRRHPHGDIAVAYTDDGVVLTTREYEENKDCFAVLAFASEFDCEVSL